MLPRTLLPLLLVACRPEVRPDPALRPEAPASSPGAMPREAPRVSAETSATPEASAAPPSASAPPAAPGGPCKIRITAILEAQAWRGPGADSPARQRTLDALSPTERDQWRGRDHALQHLRCRYAVEMNGKRYTYSHIARQIVGFDSDNELDPKKCEADRPKVEKDLIETTRGCTDPHAGAYWGFDLVEVKPP